MRLSKQARRELADGWPIVLAAALAIGVGTMGIGFYSLGHRVIDLATLVHGTKSLWRFNAGG